MILIGTGSEVSRASGPERLLPRASCPSRQPAWELLERQSQAYKDSVLPEISARVAVEQAAFPVVALGRRVGVCMRGFGAPAFFGELQKGSDHGGERRVGGEEAARADDRMNPLLEPGTLGQSIWPTRLAGRSSTGRARALRGRAHRRHVEPSIREVDRQGRVRGVLEKLLAGTRARFDGAHEALAIKDIQDVAAVLRPSSTARRARRPVSLEDAGEGRRRAAILEEAAPRTAVARRTCCQGAGDSCRVAAFETLTGRGST